MKQLNTMSPRLILEMYNFSDEFYSQYIQSIYTESILNIPRAPLWRGISLDTYIDVNLTMAVYYTKIAPAKVAHKILVKQIRELSELERVMAGLVDDSV